ncbi:hypothetical protein EQG49_08245 [Periweissella cryptocerci]|uniref:Imm-5-like domain-containing protein n=2 Tax=Periweissella cryptocerci TaxID=2506420 RepID=A0A4P6YUN3_9LACO|nr:hypothetical protein EQG49_08245 [Periweissella cryptocerci]
MGTVQDNFEIRAVLAEQLKKVNHKIVHQWSLRLVDHVNSVYTREIPGDTRLTDLLAQPKSADASVAALAIARSLEDKPAAQAVAQATGFALNPADSHENALTAADYAAKAIGLADPAKVMQERAWQLAQLAKLIAKQREKALKAHKH